MKKALLLVLVLVAIAAGGYVIRHFGGRHPVVEPAPNGWTFTYNLCMPQPPPGDCKNYPFKLYVPKGDKAIGLPEEKRVKPVVTVEDALVEAEQRADLIENVHHDAPKVSIPEKPLSALGL